MSTDSRRDDLLSVIAVIIILIATATGNAYAMLGISVTALIVLAAFYGRRIGSGSILVALVAALTAFVIGAVVASR
jgi:hypothetical protein